jgi:predicted NBD/HSP70 family sugar kinase
VLAALTAAAAIHGHVAAQLALLLNPQRIILVGPLAELGDPFLCPLREAMQRLCPGEAPEAVNSDLGSYSGAIGAAALVLHQWKPAR